MIHWLWVFAAFILSVSLDVLISTVIIGGSRGD